MNEGMRVLSLLISGPLFYGGVGWALDRWVLHTGWLAAVGLVAGVALSIVMIIGRHRITDVSRNRP